MHYSVRGTIIRAENAAKPVAAASRWMLEWIDDLPALASVLDYGCGKLRYTVPLARRVRSVVAVDSAHQLDRQQVINGTPRVTIRKYVKENLPNVLVQSTEQREWVRRRYDFSLVSNVLSAIPSRSMRVDVLHTIGRRLKPDGRILVSTQFANSHFDSWATNPRAARYNDGWLVRSIHGVSFYAIIDLASLKKHCRDAGLTVQWARTRQHGETAAVLASA